MNYIIIILSVSFIYFSPFVVFACDEFERDYIIKKLLIIQVKNNVIEATDKEFVRMAKRCGFNLLPYDLSDEKKLQKLPYDLSDKINIQKLEESVYKEAVLEKHTSFDSIIVKAANRYRLDPALIKAVIHTESSFNHTAVSNKNAYGLMQILYPTTANYLGIYKKSELFDPEVNIEAGTRYLSERIYRFNSLTRAIIAYNAGDSVAERVSHLGDMEKIPAETRLYLKRVIILYKQYAD